jgi:hypothetical protein
VVKVVEHCTTIAQRTKTTSNVGTTKFYQYKNEIVV